MKSLEKTMMAILLLLSVVVSSAQIKNSKTESVKIYGNCGMCEAKIEKAGSIKKVAKVDWNQETQMATLTYDASITNQDEILKRIALVGYDSDKFLAPEEVYNNLPGCCQYDRVVKVPVKIDAVSGESISAKSDIEMANHPAAIANQLKSVFDSYFLVKDALIASNGDSTAAAAKELVIAINNVKMDKLEMEVHMVWMKIMNQIRVDAEHIADTKDIKHQRDHFNTLSKNIYELVKVSKPETPTYLQHCPMANDGKGADWLSKENVVKNPYYGSMMLNCGKVTETIK